MVDFKRIQAAGAAGRLESETLTAFKARLQGQLLCAGDRGYDEARALWNGMIDRYPAAIARCASVADVVLAVRFAREHHLLVSVRGGGHNVAGKALCDGGLTIDLSAMKEIRVDPQRRTARAQPGVTLGELDRETQRFGLATPTGIVSATGLAGLTLGGGFGWLTRKYGFTVDNLCAAEVVTARGEVLRASEEENADLFWALRGGGGNFGIVTLFEYGLHPVGPEVLGGMLLFPMEAARDVMRFYRDFVAASPEDLGSAIVLRLAPPAPFIPASLHGKPVCAILACYAGDVATGERLLQPLRARGALIVDRIAPKPYVEMQAMLDQEQPSGNLYYWKSEYLRELSNAAIDAALEHAQGISSPLTRMVIMQLGGAMSRVEEMAMAAGNRDAAFIIAINNGWSDAADSTRQVTWTQDAWEAMRPFSTGGTYVNFLSEGEGDERVLAAYGQEKYARLVTLKTKYDPTNLFRVNQNIRPA